MNELMVDKGNQSGCILSFFAHEKLLEMIENRERLPDHKDCCHCSLVSSPLDLSRDCRVS